MKHFDIIIVGAGVMGTSVARWLARLGRSVVLLEQFEIGHARGSSHGAARIFRLSYPDEEYVEMAREALDLWRDLESECGEELLTTTGGLDMGPELQDNIGALEPLGVPFEAMEGNEAARRWPQLRLPHSTPVLFQPDSGVLAAERTVRAQARLAVARGAVLLEGARALALEVRGDAVIVHTAEESFGAGACVVTVGGWARPLLATAGIDIAVTPTRETVAYFPYEGPTLPVVAEWGTPTRYGLSSFAAGIKAGEHIAGPATDPEQLGVVSHESVERIAQWVQSIYRAAGPRPHDAETCIYTNTEDESFILERHGPIVVGSPCSGHGFKFAPLIGRRLAALAVK